MKTFRKLKWDLIHPPYSPDIAPRDIFFLFRRFKSDLEGCNLRIKNDLMCSGMGTHPTKKLLGKGNKTIAKMLEKNVCVCVFQCQPTALLCASGSTQGG